jgi:predicted pyridoxine 5'-phosphate oxidase superfamily flavin-nucleotide-binding protein
MDTNNTVHSGERDVQLRAGVHERSAYVMQHVIRDAMPEQHAELFEKLPTLLVGSLDAQRRPWASVLAGRPGFVRAPDARHLVIRALPGAGDPLSLHVDQPLGLLGLEPHTRRRNRMNGTVVAIESRGFAVEVDQSFGNCPKYIQAREPTFLTSAPQPRRPARSWEGPRLSLRAKLLVAAADTFFIASTSPRAGLDGSTFSDGVDVSHRGGNPGFVRVGEDRGRTTLTSPDFIGNFMFNTLGNLAVEPRAGIVFVDYATGDLLSLTGEGTVIWDGPELAAFQGAERLLQFHVDHGVLVPGAVPVRWSRAQPAPQLAATGSWEDVARIVHHEDWRR